MACVGRKGDANKLREYGRSKCRWRIILKLDCIKHVSKSLLLIHLAEDREGHDAGC